MAVIAGSIPVTGFIAPTDSADEYPVIDPRFGIDGLRSVDNVAARNAIPAGLRREGMVVYCADTKLYYKLGSNLTTWDLFVSSSSSLSINLPVDTDVFYPRKSDVNAALALKADQSSVNAALALKADQSSVNAALAQKANTASVNAALALKANSTNVDLALSEKANQKDVNDALALKANQVDLDDAFNALNLKASAEDLTNAVSEYTYLNNLLREQIQAEYPTYNDLAQSLNYINSRFAFTIPKPSLKVVKGTMDVGNLNDRLLASFDFSEITNESGNFLNYNPEYWLFRFNTGSHKSALDPTVRIKTKKWRHPSNSEGLGNQYDGFPKYGGIPSMSNYRSPHINIPFNRFTEFPFHNYPPSSWQEIPLEPNLWFACEVDKSSVHAPSPWPYGSATLCKVQAPTEFTDMSWQTSVYPYHDFTPTGRRQNLSATYNQNTGTPKKHRRFNQLFRIAIVIDNPYYQEGDSDPNTRKIIGPYSDTFRLRIQAKVPSANSSVDKKLAFMYFL